MKKAYLKWYAYMNLIVIKNYIVNLYTASEIYIEQVNFEYVLQWIHYFVDAAYLVFKWNILIQVNLNVILYHITMVLSVSHFAIPHQHSVYEALQSTINIKMWYRTESMWW